MELHEYYIKYNKLVKRVIIEKNIVNYEFGFEENNKYRYYKILDKLYLEYNPTNDNDEIIIRDNINNDIHMYNYKKIINYDEIQPILKYMKNTTFWNKLKLYNEYKQKYIFCVENLLHKYEINDNFDLSLISYTINEFNIIGIDIIKYNQIISNLKNKKEINILPINNKIKLKFPYDEQMVIFGNISKLWYFININNLYFYIENNIKYIIVEQNNIFYFLNKNQNNFLLQKIISKMILILSNNEFKIELENILFLRNNLGNEYLKIIPNFNL
jgi:hypothetical protein